MQKKLLAVAVAGALGAPAIALAQTSTVQVFGTIYMEYARIKQGTGQVAGAANLNRQSVDMLQTPGSEIGFKGEEKLGGGLSAWFQCASTADVRGQSQDGWCSRNSAIGLKGGFGNVYIGNWDTPFKRTISPTNVGGNDTGVFGTANLLTAGSTTVFGNAGPANFKRRQNNMIMYDSPDFGGFQVMAGYTAINNATATSTGAANRKPRVMSLGGQYSAGPLYVSAGFERHKDFLAAQQPAGVFPTADPPVGATVGSAAGTREGDADGWHVGAAYTWGPVRFGGQYTRQKFDNVTALGAAADTRVSAYTVGVDWTIVGPHGLRAAYTRANDVKGTPGALAVGGTQGQARPAVPAAGAANNTGARQWQVRYVYTLSKRTEFTAGYVNLRNEAAATYDIFGVSAATAGSPGNHENAYALGIRHTF